MDFPRGHDHAIYVILIRSNRISARWQYHIPQQRVEAGEEREAAKLLQSFTLI